MKKLIGFAVGGFLVSCFRGSWSLALFLLVLRCLGFLFPGLFLGLSNYGVCGFLFCGSLGFFVSWFLGFRICWVLGFLIS